MKVEFDFLCDTMLHVSEVQENLEQISSELRKRAFAHDRTKFQALEFDSFVSTREDFKKANYGTPEYQKCCDIVQPALDNHYSNNRHHTGYHKNGIYDMNLIDILEMLADWKAASRRSPTQTFKESLPKCYKKYNINETLQKIIETTLKDLGWI
jgi:hypothetical protein